jgi:signal transduction histidine kinase
VHQAPSTAQDRLLRALPFGLLALAVGVGLGASTALGQTARQVSAQLLLAACAAGWMAVWTWGVTPSPGRLQVAFVGRTTLAFVLTWLNPFYAIFAFIGFLDAFDSFRGRRAWLAILPVAVTMAGSQSGGLPPQDRMQWGAFAALFVLNAGLSIAFTEMHRSVEKQNTTQAGTIADLERLLAENETLHRTVLTQAREAGVQQERQRLAREIHDTIAQGLAGVVAQLQAAHEHLGEGPARPHVDRAVALARQSLAEARRSVQDLAPAPLADSGLVDALSCVVADWSGARPVKADLVVTGQPVALHAEIEATLLRITQEALTNVARHAAATRVGVTLSYGEDEVILDVRDDGVGFDPARPVGESSFGLRGMRQRAERLEGVLDLESAPAQGTAVSVRLPALPAGVAA